jgi:hypothetical protein
MQLPFIFIALAVAVYLLPFTNARMVDKASIVVKKVDYLGCFLLSFCARSHSHFPPSLPSPSLPSPVSLHLSAAMRNQCMGVLHQQLIAARARQPSADSHIGAGQCRDDPAGHRGAPNEGAPRPRRCLQRHCHR